MQRDIKDWLVRTRTGEILGPFSQRELTEEMKKRTFCVDDEIAQSHCRWISAQTLTNRDLDEFTQTRTRNQTVTKSVHTSPAGALAEDTITPTSESEGLTPTPTTDSISLNTDPQETSAKAFGFPARNTAANRGPDQWDRYPAGPRFAPLFVSAVVIGGLWFLVSNLKPRAKPGTPGPAASSHAVTGIQESDSPFVRQIYSLVHAGESQTALRQLTQFHEKTQAKGDLEYLIPYAALLITEGDSPSRARKFLELVLSSGATVQLKSRAHHWLGYLMLSEDEGDMGESHFLEALQLNPKDAAARFNLGRAYLKQKKFSQALDYLNLAELEVPDLWLVHIYKGRAKAAMGNMDEARTAFKKAVESSPDRWIPYLYYAVFLSAIKEGDAAQIMMKKMLTRDPQYEANSPPPWGFYEERVPYSEYLDTFDDIMGKSMGEEREMGKLYISYLMNGSAAEAKHIEAVAEKGGLMAKVLALKVALDRDASMDTIRTATNRLPTHLKDFGYYAYVLRGDSRTRLSQFAEAQQDLQTAMLLEPQSAVARWANAVLLRKMGREADSHSEVKSLLSYHPNYIPAIVATHNN